MRFLFLIILTSLVSGCTTNYYICEATDASIELYSDAKSKNSFWIIPKNHQILVKGNKSNKNKAEYGEKHGYIYNFSSINKVKRISRTDLKYIAFSDSVYYYNGKRIIRTYDNSYTNKSSYSGGPVHVKGYYRKNGTYVKPYTRSAPSRRR